jgi:hypothetical protein
MACTNLKVGDQSTIIRLPGGLTLQPLISTPVPSNLQVVKNLLSQSSAYLGPLAPVFNLIESVLAVKDFAEAVPKILFDPPAVVEAIVKLVEKISKLASLIPQLSVPILIVDLIDVVIISLNGVVDEYEVIIDKINEIENAKQIGSSENNTFLLQVIECAEELLDIGQSSVASSMEPLNSLFAVINLFMNLIGQEGIPPIDDLSDDPEEAIDELNATIKVLTDIRNAIPIP